jgi:hypothetical protein
MPRLPADPVGRLARLEAARSAVEPGLVVNAAELETIVGVTWRHLKNMIDDDPEFPVIQRGDMGVPWQFDAAAVIDHMIAQAQAARSAREAQSGRVHRLAGMAAEAGRDPEAVDRPETFEAPLTVSDLGKLVQVNRDFQRAKIEQGLLIPAERAEQGVIDYNNVVQSAILDSAQRADPAGIWPTEIRTAWENEARNMLVAIQDAALKWVDTIRGHRP